MYGERSLRLYWRIGLFVRHVNQVLRVKCAERCRYSLADANDPFFHAWPKQCNPQIAAKQQLRATHSGGTLRMGRAINVHLLARRRCIIDDVAPLGVLAISVHLRLERVSARERM